MSSPAIAPLTFREKTEEALKTHQFDAWFTNWIYNNWHIWSHFNQSALQMANTGRAHYSAYTVIEVMRWEHDIVSTGGKFKISNNAIPRLARLFKYVNPEHANFFTTKPSARLQA